MRRLTQLIILTLILIPLLVSCTYKNKNNGAPVGSSPEKNTQIIIQSPMTLSNNDMFRINGKNQYLRLKMIKGRYYEDWNIGAYTGTIWEGDFILEVADESGKVIAQTDLSKIYNEPMIFNSNFNIEFDDYNGDGDADFTIGQYASSNGRNYKLFTIRKDGKVEELPVKNYPVLFVSKSTGFYSTKLTKVDKITFKKEYYDNTKGRNFGDIFKWENKEFVLVKTMEIKNN